MKFRTKLLIMFILVVVISNSLAIMIIYSQTKNHLFHEIQGKVLSIAATVAASLDGDMVREVREREDEKKASYLKVRDQLKNARNANRREDIYIDYIYTMYLDPNNPKLIHFGVDPEEDPMKKSHAGDVYKSLRGRDLRIGEYQVDTEYTKDRWGEWLSANAPIRNRNLTPVASLGVDLSVSDVSKKMKLMLLSGVVAGLVSLVLTVIIAVFLSRRVSRPLSDLHNAVDMVGKGQFNIRMTGKMDGEFREVADAVEQMAAGLRERETLKRLFALYQSHQLLEKVLKEGDSPDTRRERKKITVLFADIRDFTLMAEDQSPELVAEQLNEYFDRMVEIVTAYKGTVDKFIGDGIMVLFGALEEDLFQEENAVRAAMGMIDALKGLSEKWQAEGKPVFRIGIGINSGTAVVGNIGSERHMEYTATGDTVVLAARVEAKTRELDREVLISEYTYVAVKNICVTESMGILTVKGRVDPVAIHAVQRMK